MKYEPPTRFRRARIFCPLALIISVVFIIYGVFNPEIETNAAPLTNSAATAGGSLDTSFRPSIEALPGSIRASATQPDGKIIAGGYFRTLNGVRYKSLVRLNADQSIDPSFNTNVNGTVNAITIQTDGKVVIGGSFISINGVGRNRIARLNSDGSLDTAFAVGNGADGAVNDIVVQPDGKILVGGLFTIINSTFRNVVARLNADGSVDSTFTSPFPPVPPPFPSSDPDDVPSAVFAIALQPDGKIVVGGLLVINYPGQVRYFLVRLNPNGTIDSSLDVRLNSDVYDVIVQPDDKLLVAGFFTTVNGVSRRYLTRINANGTLDTSFDAGTAPTGPVRTMFLKPDGKILFGQLAGASSAVAKQLTTTGTLDTTFVPTQSVFGTVYTITATGNDKVLVAGSLDRGFNDLPNAALLFNANGSPDNTFSLNSTATGGTRAILPQPDGKVIVGGNFTQVNGELRVGLARINTDGTLDTGFNAQTGTVFISSNSRVTELRSLPDGKTMVGGSGLRVGSTAGYQVIRIGSDGSPDASFVQGVTIRGTLKAMAVQADGKVLISPGSAASPTVARLNADGSLDSSFVCDLPIAIESLVTLPDGKVLAGGPFAYGYVNSGTGSEFHRGVLRLNSNGSHDRTFISGFAPDSMGARFTNVYDVELAASGKILVGGTLYTAASADPSGVARLNADGTLDGSFQLGAVSNPFDAARVEDVQLSLDGRILAGGLFSSYGGVSRSNVVRLQQNGSLDADFAAGTDDTVYKISVQQNNNVLLGGDFDFVNGAAQSSLARILGDSSVARTPFDYDGDGRSDLSVRRSSDDTWYLQRSAAGYTALTWGVAGDLMVPADYDGDGKTDVAVFRPSEGRWYVLMSGSGAFQVFNWGAAGDLPVPADHDGDGRADLVVYRESTSTWYASSTVTGPFRVVQFGAAGDRPQVGDFDGDGRADPAVFRPADNVWYLLRTGGGGFTAQTWGEAGDVPVPADYDGDGKTDIAVYRRSLGRWYVSASTAGFYTVNWGVNTDTPVPADYDGDGRADPAVFRPSEGRWYLNRSTAGLLSLPFGQTGDLPTQGAFLY